MSSENKEDGQNLKSVNIKYWQEMEEKEFF